jgi:hypothetical protein
MNGTILLSPRTPSWHGARLKHGDNFIGSLYHTLCMKEKSNLHELYQKSLLLQKLIENINMINMYHFYSKHFSAGTVKGFLPRLTSVQTGSDSHPFSYPLGTRRGLFPKG